MSKPNISNLEQAIMELPESGKIVLAKMVEVGIASGKAHVFKEKSIVNTSIQYILTSMAEKKIIDKDTADNVLYTANVYECISYHTGMVSYDQFTEFLDTFSEYYIVEGSLKKANEPVQNICKHIVGLGPYNYIHVVLAKVFKIRSSKDDSTQLQRI